ncbi:MAG: hypothetical protein FWE68_02010 [Defluviitaleaceae bacterium]|nr:hypothetical protein [Defluviitaleaceae bacterium]
MSGIYEVGDYFRKLNDTLVAHHKGVTKNPPREVRLLQAMKAFMPTERHSNVDRVIDIMMLAGTMGSIREERISSVHPDGVYDIDASCVTGRDSTSGFMLMALAAMAQK